MKNLFFITVILFGLYSCGGAEEEPAPPPPPNTEKTTTTETTVENPMDSVLMAEFMELTKGTQNTDSLKMMLDSLALSNAGLVELIEAMKDTIDNNFPIVHPKPVIDLTDYNKPPDGNKPKGEYKIFKNYIPTSGKTQSKFPSDLIGSYVSSNSSKSKLKITSTDITYTKDNDTAMFIIASNRIYTVSNDVHILNYETESGWVTVLLELNTSNLSFKIIPENAGLGDSPTKKELKGYLEGNKGSVESVYIKVR